MTDDKINIAIAEACGWRFNSHSLNEGWYSPTGRTARDVPDYCYDLNAMHEAEEGLFPKEVSQLSGPDRVAIYHAVLCKLCIGNSGFTFRATARQRAEAFLKTIGKWKE